MTTKPTVLFICKHNAGRSQLGAALLELAASDRYTATSAGITPAEEVNPSIAATVGELGLDITDHTPRKVTAELLVVTRGRPPDARRRRGPHPARAPSAVITARVGAGPHRAHRAHRG